MSFEAAVGRIDQILQLQQQLLNPASLMAGQSSTSTAATASSDATGTGASSDFASMLASAQGLTGTSSSATGATSLTGATSSAAGATSVTGGSAGAAANPQVQAMVNEANSLVGKPYVYGGGHSGWGPQAGYDCSGFVSAVLHAGGYLSSPQDTVTLPSQPGMESGPGQYVTVYDRALSGENGHVIIDINGQFYESGGEHGSWGGGGGVEKINTPSAAYLATFPTILHPAGL
ncbi:MAG TPA: hypothetical protein VHX62_04225 [Solirubrobacteraceae bacterium]|jgi:cell wall-associated NlpC family hydrolase|nr:hypothetical protein [Solirubrobacteraceae bacterium]